jgi:hypothetical protein
MPPQFLPLLLQPANCIKPPQDLPVVLYFPSGAVRIGFWDGAEWVCAGGADEPEQWQQLPRAQIAA